MGQEFWTIKTEWLDLSQNLAGTRTKKKTGFSNLLRIGTKFSIY